MRYKTNITNFTIYNIDNFIWDEALTPKKYYHTDAEEWEIGLIAEEVAELCPFCVTWELNPTSQELEPLMVKYDKMAYALVLVIRNHRTRINAIETETCALNHNFSWC